MHSLTSNVSSVSVCVLSGDRAYYCNPSLLSLHQTMRYLDSLLEYSESLGEIFEGRNSYSLSSGSTDAGKKKAVGQYVGEW